MKKSTTIYTLDHGKSHVWVSCAYTPVQVGKCVTPPVIPQTRQS